jgi:hypothetical protein
MPEGIAADLDTKTKKKHELFNLVGNKIVNTVGMDGAWQKRGSGHAYNSLTGHNYMLGAHTGLIVGLQAFYYYSKK